MNKHFTNQLRTVHDILKSKPMTMMELSVYSKILRANICRYVSTLLKQGKIAVTRKRKCSITGYPDVKEYTTNPELFPKSNQLKLF